MKSELKPCGTYAAYRRHKYHGETPCVACVNAFSAYTASTRNVNKSREAAKAQGRAKSRLRAMFPTEWKALYSEELGR